MAKRHHGAPRTTTRSYVCKAVKAVFLVVVFLDAASIVRMLLGVPETTTPVPLHFEEMQQTKPNEATHENTETKIVKTTTPKTGIVYLTNEQHLERKGRVHCPTMFHSLRSLVQYFPHSNHKSSPKVYVLHDAPLHDSTRLAITLAASPFSVTFHAVSLQQNQTSSNLNQGQLGYRQMCHFWFDSIFDLKNITLPDYVMRMDTDTCLTSTMPMDPFQYMQRNDVHYMYHSTFEEKPHAIPELYNYIKAQKGVFPHNDPLRLWQTSSSPHETMEVFSTNLEWLYMPVFGTPPLYKWTSKIKQHGGVFRHRWGDAPLRTIAVAAFFHKRRVARFCNFSYRHSAWDPFEACDETKGKRLSEEYRWNVV